MSENDGEPEKNWRGVLKLTAAGERRFGNATPETVPAELKLYWVLFVNNTFERLKRLNPSTKSDSL